MCQKSLPEVEGEKKKAKRKKRLKGDDEELEGDVMTITLLREKVIKTSVSALPDSSCVFPAPRYCREFIYMYNKHVGTTACLCLRYRWLYIDVIFWEGFFRGFI
jgi:hypothetical protein